MGKKRVVEFERVHSSQAARRQQDRIMKYQSNIHTTRKGGIRGK